MTLKQLYKPEKVMRVAAFMSGTGTNLRKILETKGNFEVAMIFTDNADERCNAKKIAFEFGIDYYCNDISKYYSSRGYDDRKNMDVRKEYDRETVKLLEKHAVDVVVLCGYMSLVTEEICNKFLTVNVHPADLRILDSNGKRMYAGCMGADCVRKVIENTGKEIRSSTHIVTTEVDGGPVLMVSEPVEVSEPDKVHEYFEKLKENGDWKIYPETIKRLAEGRFWTDESIVLDLVEEKSLLREKLKELRERLSDDEVKGKSSEITKRLLQLQEYVNAKTVMFYMGVNKEVQTEDAVSNALAANKKVAVPVTDLDNGRIIASHLESLNSMKPGAYGIPEPNDVKEVDAKQIELVVIPGLAFDEKGNRVGYGLGFFDKFLKNFNGKKIALSYESQIVDMIRTTEQDVAVDKIITEQRVIECR